MQDNEAINLDPRVHKLPEYKNPCQFGFSGYDPMLCALVTGEELFGFHMMHITCSITIT